MRKESKVREGGSWKIKGIGGLREVGGGVGREREERKKGGGGLRECRDRRTMNDE